MKALVLLLLLASTVHAIPRFHQVNKFYHNGTACPATTKYNVQCPVLCVADPEQDCPGPISQQTCPYKLCPDGSCQADCTGIANICECATHPTTTQLYPCAANKLNVNITHYDPANADKQMYLACASALNLSSTIPVWQGYTANNADAVWNVCDAPPSLVFPSQAPTFISYLVIYLSFYAFLALWLAYKTFREKVIRATTDARQQGLSDHAQPPAYNEKGESSKEYQQQRDQTTADRFKGYSDDWFGYWLVFYCGIISVGWMVFLLVISLDYYGYVTGTPYGLFYDSYPLSSKAFCVAWFLSTSWYLSINLMRSRLRNFFRIRQPLDKAQYIQVERLRRVQFLDTTYSRSVILDHVLRAEARLRRMLGLDYIVVTLPVKKSDTNRRYFEYHSARYIYQTETNTFEQLPISVSLSSQGLSTQEAQERMDLVGPNVIDVHVPSFLKAMWEELTGFFYLYQIMILWCYFYLAYWQIGVADTGVILLAAIIKVIVRLRSEKRIKAMAEHVGACKVLRDGQWQTAASCAILVPGDMIQIEPHQIVPVDAVVLQGDIVVDESSLTGEPLPIRKFPLREELGQAGKVNKLYAGTTVKQASPDSIALVLATRTNTDKGKLVQKILFPQPVSFIFHQQLKLVFAILICWAIFLLGIGSWWLGGTGMTAWFYGMTCAAQVMNPLIPAILVVGQSVAGGRLRKLGIYCVDLPRILMAGKVQVFCFDKTGTLTKEGLEYYGIYPVENHRFSDFKQQYNDLDTSSQTEKLLRLGVASCHSVTTLADEYIGNPVDIAMFQATGSSIDDNTVILPPPKPDTRSQRLEIIQRFEFQHARASMSVAVLDTVTKHVHVFCKGSFERFKSAHNVPDDYDLTASKLAREGCYVLAMAHRGLGTDIDPETVRSWTRDELESGLSLLGLVLFKNLLKEDTADAIAQLKQGDIRTVMITGDNALTGISISQACGLLPADAPVLLADVHDGQLVWSNPETGEPANVEKARAAQPDLELVMTGVAFRTLLDTDPQLLRNYLFSTRIFARMTPVDKMVCVELFMERAITAMCGDGGNDCGALRSAHVGIAMSEAEASVVSPFSTPRRSVQACVDLIIQGRAALATSFASYKYLIMYGETMATVKFCTFYYTMSFSQWNFILIDAFITVFCSFAVTQAKAATKLSAQRPTARILGPEVLSSVLGQLFINAWFLAGAYIWLYTRDDFFRCHEWDARATDSSKWWLLGDSFEADVLTFISLYQFVNAALIFNYGYQFRKAWYHNYLLLFLWALFVSIVSYWELADPNPFGCAVRLNCGNPDVLVSLGYPRPDFYIEQYNNPLGHNVLPRTFRYQLWAYAIGNMIVTHAWELLVVLGPVRNWFRKRYPVPRPYSKL